MSERLKFKCDVYAAKCRISIRVAEEDEYPFRCLQDCYEPIWIEVSK